MAMELVMEDSLVKLQGLLLLEDTLTQSGSMKVRN